MALSLLAIDVGNSRTKFGLFTSDAAVKQPALPELQRVLAVSRATPLPWQELSDWRGDGGSADHVSVLAGVDPARVAQILKDWPANGWPPPRVVRRAAELPLPVRVDAPDGVGIDRLLAAVAANALRAPQRAAVIVSCGTATTIDLVAPDGGFEGGAVLAGLDLAARSLHEHTALLPRIPWQDLVAPDLPVTGKNTAAAIRSGLLYGHVGAVQELLGRMSAGLRSPPEVFLTGGGGPLLVAHLPPDVRLSPEMALRALAWIGMADPCRIGP